MTIAHMPGRPKPTGQTADEDLARIGQRPLTRSENRQ